MDVLRDVGRFEIESVAGTGAFGIVYRARDRDTGRACAVKVLRAAKAPSGRAGKRFLREIAALARVKHPNIVELIDSGTLDDGRPYLVTEWIDGETIASVLARGPIAFERAGRIARQIAEALSVVHDAGFVHRDLKSSNVMLRKVNGRELACLLDFGMVRDWTNDWTRLTALGAPLGTPLYAAPESLRGEEVTRSADLYSLGVMLYEMVIGARPFTAQSLDDLLALDRSIVPRIERCGPFAGLIASLLSTDPRERPQDAREVLARLPPPDDDTTVLRAEPTAVLTEIDPTVPLAEKPAPRAPRAGLPIALLSLGLSLIVLAFAWSRQRAIPEQIEAPAAIPLPAPNPTAIARERAEPVEPPPPEPLPAPKKTLAAPIKKAKPPPPIERSSPIAPPESLRARVDRIGRRLKTLAASMEPKDVRAFERRFLDVSVLVDRDGEPAPKLEAQISALEADLERFALPAETTYRRSE